MGETKLKKLFGVVKTYATHVFAAYIDFAVPVALFAVFMGAAAQWTDPEKVGLLYMHNTALSEEERERKFPSKQKPAVKVPAKTSAEAEPETA